MITLKNLQTEMVFAITERGESRGWGPKGSKAVVKAVKIDNSGDIIIGICFDASYHTKYHDLDGMVKNGYGYWLTPAQLLSDSSFTLLQEDVILKPGIKLKEKDIGSKQGHILKHLSNTNYVMVELLENIEGCSGDGLGKAGHCIILEKDRIDFKHKKKENKS